MLSHGFLQVWRTPLPLFSSYLPVLRLFAQFSIAQNGSLLQARKCPVDLFSRGKTLQSVWGILVFGLVALHDFASHRSINVMFHLKFWLKSLYLFLLSSTKLGVSETHSLFFSFQGPHIQTAHSRKFVPFLKYYIVQLEGSLNSVILPHKFGFCLLILRSTCADRLHRIMLLFCSRSYVNGSLWDRLLSSSLSALSRWSFVLHCDPSLRCLLFSNLLQDGIVREAVTFW